MAKLRESEMDGTEQIIPEIKHNKDHTIEMYSDQIKQLTKDLKEKDVLIAKLRDNGRKTVDKLNQF